jgi:hypothetical protein
MPPIVHGVEIDRPPDEVFSYVTYAEDLREANEDHLRTEQSEKPVHFSMPQPKIFGREEEADKEPEVVEADLYREAQSRQGHISGARAARHLRPFSCTVSASRAAGKS